jgi:hypothetical protein
MESAMLKAIAVFTGKSVERMLEEGGTSAWVLNPARAEEYDYVVCTRNVDWREGDEAHGSAFLVGKVSGVEKLPDERNRYLIRFGEYALTDLPNVWQGWRNPVRYSTLEELGIDLAKLEFRPMPQPTASTRTAAEAPEKGDGAAVGPSTIIDQAKAGIAAALGLKPSQIEITIRA